MEGSSVTITLYEYDKLKEAAARKDWDFMWEYNDYECENLNRGRTLKFCTKDEAFLAMNERNRELEIMVASQRDEIDLLKERIKKRWKLF